MKATYLVVFTSIRNTNDHEYGETNDHLFDQIKNHPGFVEAFSTRDAQRRGVTISYWTSLEAVNGWRIDADHQKAKYRKEEWYEYYRIDICKIEKSYEWKS
jgi:heme-degrading monooxygenase HmoA